MFDSGFLIVTIDSKKEEHCMQQYMRVMLQQRVQHIILQYCCVQLM